MKRGAGGASILYVLTFVVVILCDLHALPLPPAVR